MPGIRFCLVIVGCIARKIVNKRLGNQSVTLHRLTDLFVFPSTMLHSYNIYSETKRTSINE